MANKYVGAAQFVGEKIIKPIVKSFTKKQKTTGTEVIKSFKPVKNLTTKRKIQDKTVKAVDEGTKKGMKAAGADPKFLTSDQKTALRQSMSKIKREKSKELKDYSYRLDKLTEKKATGGRVGKMGGGMMGRRMGYSRGNPKPKTNVEKIKKAFSTKTKIKFDAKKSDLDKSGSLSPYEKRRGMAIAKAMAKRKKKV